MTDYLYGLSLTQQAQGFLLSLGFGFLMGILYDFLRIIRICISKSKAVTIFMDILYCITLCFCFFLFCLTVNQGEIRLYLLSGAFSGFCVYYFSLGLIVLSTSERLVFYVKEFFRLIFTPLRLFLGKTRKLFNKVLIKSRKNSKNIKNKSKFLLKVNRLMLYNLFDKK